MSIAELVKLPEGKREVKASSWRAVRTDWGVQIYHHSTVMAEVQGDTLRLVSHGHGSQTDKCGVYKLRRGAERHGLAVEDLR
jgi:hypothetical protein